MTTAIRAAITANWRVAIIDAATAVEVALTAGLIARLSDEASSHVTQELLDKTRTLGGRLGLAKRLGMPLPDKINEDLVQRRNAVVHQGADMTGAPASARPSKPGWTRWTSRGRPTERWDRNTAERGRDLILRT